MPRFGVNQDFVWTTDKQIPSLINAMKDAGVQAVRLPIRWITIEPERGKWDFIKVDPVVHALHNSHLELLPVGPAYAAKLVRDTLLVMEKNGDGQKPLWITETGLGTGNSVTEQTQAEHLTGIYGEMANIPQVKAIYWFLLRDMDKSVCGGEDSMGLISTTGRRKPAFEAFVKVAKK